MPFYMHLGTTSVTLKGEPRNVSPFRSVGVGGVGAPCIESLEVAKCNASFRLIMWSWKWSCEWREITVVSPLSELRVGESGVPHTSKS
jgi:hypothetical protein